MTQTINTEAVNDAINELFKDGYTAEQHIKTLDQLFVSAVFHDQYRNGRQNADAFIGLRRIQNLINALEPKQ
jgi:hypothetical protein